jgi:DNA-binding NarL/FixJ family response regulator
MFVRVAVFDPLPVFRRGIIATLSEAGFQVEAPDDLRAWIGEQQRTLVLLTLQSADDWAQLLEVHRLRDDVAIIAIVVDTSASTYVRALSSGAVGVVPRDAPLAAVTEAFEAAMSGKSILPIEVLRALIATGAQATHNENIPAGREIDWLHQLANGLTVGQLAARVGYSERMMFRLLRDLYDRLHVKGRTEALMLARERGWL